MEIPMQEYGKRMRGAAGRGQGMGIIKAVNLIFDYIRHDDEENKDEINHALRGVSLDIAEGSFVAVLGHNGSGKSTLAKLMNGILLPTDRMLRYLLSSPGANFSTWKQMPSLRRK